MQMKSVSKVQFGQLNDKRVYFSNGLLSLPYGRPLLTNVRKQKDKYRDIQKIIQTKKDEFLKEESKVIKKNTKVRYFRSNIQPTTILVRSSIRKFNIFLFKNN